MVNIYNISVTRSKHELDYFYKTIHFLQFTELKDTFVQILHLDFKFNQVVKNIKLNKVNLPAMMYIFGPNGATRYPIVISCLDCVTRAFTKRPGTSIWVYTGHSDGIYLGKNKLNLMRIEDFCEVVYRVSTKADLMVFDCCLCANINVLYICYPFTKYLMASSSYQSYLSVFETHNIYRYRGSIPEYCKNIIKELGSLEKIDPEAYDTNFVVYRMNESVMELAKLTLAYKDQFKMKKSYVINISLYKDLVCCFRELGINVEEIINKIVVFSRYIKEDCKNHKLNKKKDYSIPSKLMVLLKPTKRNGISARGEIFFKNVNFS